MEPYFPSAGTWIATATAAKVAVWPLARRYPHILRGHKGAIKIYSEPGKGTTIKVLFPETADPTGEERWRATRKTDEDGWHGTVTVLLADDEEAVRAVAKRMLERLGFTVLQAADGREAVEVFEQHAEEITCVLLDLTMPHLDGEEAFREMRHGSPQGDRAAKAIDVRIEVGVVFVEPDTR